MPLEERKPPAGLGQAADGASGFTNRAKGQYSHGAVDATEIYAEVRRLHDAGFSLLPLSPERKPLVAFQGRQRLPAGVVIGRMQAAESMCFGLRLPGILAIDDDAETPASLAFIERNFGASPYRTKTRRGTHHLYRHDGRRPAPIQFPGGKIDIKANANSFVVCPPSIRSDGLQYQAIGLRLERVADLPAFRDARPKAANRARVPEGSRHPFLFERALQYGHTASDYSELLGDLLALRTIECDDPQTVTDSEVENIARRVWEYRVGNRLWSGRDSAVQLNRTAIDQLCGIEHGYDALGLLTVLTSNHGHHSGKRFPLVYEAMRQAGLTALSRNHFRRAIEILIDVGLIRRLGQAGFSRACLYQLSNGKGGSLYLESQYRTTRDANITTISNRKARKSERNDDAT